MISINRGIEFNNSIPLETKVSTGFADNSDPFEEEVGVVTSYIDDSTELVTFSEGTYAKRLA